MHAVNSHALSVLAEAAVSVEAMACKSISDLLVSPDLRLTSASRSMQAGVAPFIAQNQAHSL